MKSSVCLYQEHTSDISNCIKRAISNHYDLIATPIVNPLFYREFDYEPIKSKHLAFSRSDLILTSSEWSSKVISLISDYIDCDSDNELIRKHSEKTLKQELSFSEHVVQHGCVMIKIKSQKTINLARNVCCYYKGTILAHVPMIDQKINKQVWRKDYDENTSRSIGEDTWSWWNKFRTFTDFNSNIKLALELSEDIPNENEIRRWLGEQVEFIIISTEIFIRNNRKYPVLSRSHQDILEQFINNNVHFIVKTSFEDPNINCYSQYLKHLVEKFKKVDPMHGFDDVLEIPLQPLYDNLDTYTYEIFEKDPIKYKYYQKAIEQALLDKVPDPKKFNKPIIIMVVGAGRGPLVRAALNASKNTNRPVKIYVIEKNPNAIVTLTALVEELWQDKDIQIISCDMRDFQPPEKADIMVSELLGSFGDNELSPECLDGAQKHLKKNGISIPCQSTSYLNPIMSPKLLNFVRHILNDRNSNIREKICGYATHAENSYVVYFKNVYHISEPQPLFVFKHPNKDKTIDNSRFKTIKFNVTQDCVLHGFAGYFDTILYKDIVISIHPQTYSKGLCSWFSMFFPIMEPQQLKAGDELEVNFWRCVSSHKVWYEWSTSSPVITHIHNHNGRSCPIFK